MGAVADLSAAPCHRSACEPQGLDTWASPETSMGFVVFFHFHNLEAKKGGGPKTRETKNVLFIPSLVRVRRPCRGLPCSAKAGLLKIAKLALAGLKIGRYVFSLEKDVQPTCGSLAETFGLLEEFHTKHLNLRRPLRSILSPKGMTFVFYVSRPTFFENQCGNAEKNKQTTKK